MSPKFLCTFLPLLSAKFKPLLDTSLDTCDTCPSVAARSATILFGSNVVLVKPVTTPSLPLITTGFLPSPIVMLSEPTVVFAPSTFDTVVPAAVVTVLLPA